MDDMRAMMQDELRQALSRLLPPSATTIVPVVVPAPTTVIPLTVANPPDVDAPPDNARGNQ